MQLKNLKVFSLIEFWYSKININDVLPFVLLYYSYSIIHILLYYSIYYSYLFYNMKHSISRLANLLKYDYLSLYKVDYQST